MFIQLFRSVFKFLLNCGKAGSSLILMGMLFHAVRAEQWKPFFTYSRLYLGIWMSLQFLVL